ncbi:hypothetical protein HNY73_022465 [Argiope bruennichi]|uniref:WAP domain-containing protein n=1 Tax=Argiope bruennichi TaxID=94029 RepID=A0A8T0E2A4_ARGBR|nr:hypothetical protein HNY73_022465 [Argiope bruennichi]
MDVCVLSLLYDCPEMLSMGCCSNSDCHGGDVCCKVRLCETQCQPPKIDGRSRSYHVSPEECSALQKRIMDRHSGRDYLSF